MKFKIKGNYLALLLNWINGSTLKPLRPDLLPSLNPHGN